MAAYTAGFMTHVTCRLTAKNRDQLRNPTLGNRVLATFLLFGKALSNFIYRQVIEQNKTIYSKHQNTTDMLDYQAVTHTRIEHKVSCK